MQPGSDVHPCKRACLPEPLHLSGLPLADGKESSHGYFLLMRHEPSVQQAQDDVLVGKESVRLLFNSSQRTGVAFVMTVLL